MHRIEKLERLDTLTDLNCLSIGNNQINDLHGTLQVQMCSLEKYRAHYGLEMTTYVRKRTKQLAK
jgi:hypothetical protein